MFHSICSCYLIFSFRDSYLHGYEFKETFKVSLVPFFLKHFHFLATEHYTQGLEKHSVQLMTFKKILFFFFDSHI